MTHRAIDSIRALVRPVVTVMLIAVECWIVLAQYPSSPVVDSFQTLALMAATTIFGERATRNVIRTWKAQAGKGRG